MKTLGSMFFLIAGSLLVWMPAWAGQAEGKVRMMQLATRSHTLVVELDGEQRELASCNNTQRWAVHLDEPGGHAMFETILKAKQFGYALKITGYGTCRNEWKAEDVKILVVE